MEMTLPQDTIEEAVKLYLAHAGLIREVTHMDFGRKLKGEDAGITVTLQLSSEYIPAEKLIEIAHSARNAVGVPALGLTNQPTQTPAEPENTAQIAPQEPAPAQNAQHIAGVGTEETQDGFFTEDDEIPMNTPEPAPEPAPEPETKPELQTAAVSNSPFDEPELEPEVKSEPEPELVAATAPAPVEALPTPQVDSDNPFAMDEQPSEQPPEQSTQGASAAEAAAALFGS